MIYKLILLITCIQTIACCYGQNIISNGDFEGPGCDTMNCYNFIKRAKWYLTSDLVCCPLIFTANVNDKTRIAQNSFAGSQKPHKGKVYISINENIFLYTAFTKPLEHGKNYCFTMYISLPDKFAKKSEIGAIFQKYIEKGDENNPNPLTYYKPSFDLILQEKDTGDWIKLCGTYKANGGEKYVVIGNFSSVYKNKPNSYIFVDDVSMIPILDNNIECCKEDFNAKSGDTITLKNLLFKSSSSTIENSSYDELDRLTNYLKQNLLFRIQINGHTDNSGNTQNNIELSKSRAKSIYSYLLSKGIKAERMKYNGYGCSKPLMANNTDENKAKNRRVEIIFTK